jgi:flagellar hook-length control protein FliK
VNGLTPPKSGATEWPPGPSPRASRGAPEPRDAFAGILDSHQARTATAEGQDRSPKVKGDDRHEDGTAANDRAEARPERERSDKSVKCERPVQHHEDDAQTAAKPAVEPDAAAVATPVADGQASSPQGDAADQQPAPTGQPVQQPAAEQVTVPTALLAALATTAPAEQDAPVAAAPAAETAVKTAPVQQQSQPQQQKQQEPAQAAVVDLPDVPSAVPAEPVAPQAASPAQTADTAAAPVPPPTDAPANRPEVPEALQRADVKGKPAGQQPQGQQQGQQGSLPQQAPDQARTVAQAYGRNEQTQNHTEVPTAQQSGQPAASPATPVASSQPAAARGGLPPATPVPLARAAETVEHIMRLASSRGVTHARIALNPESLGSIDVHLRHTSEGLMAKVVAHSPEAMVQLQQAAHDLRRQLEDQGVNLLGLDIGQSDDDSASARAGAEFGDAARDDGAPAGDGGDAAGGDDEVTTNSTLRLPNGVLVDVLA